MTPYKEGYTAYLNNVAVTDNPHADTPQKEHEWRLGWCDAQRINALKPAPDAHPGANRE